MNYPVSIVRFGLVLFGLASVSTLKAEVLQQYNFTTFTSSASQFGTNIVTTSGSLPTGTGLTAGAGLTFSRSSVTGNGSPFGSIFIVSNVAEQATSDTSTDFLAFKVSATSGNNLDLSGLSFDYAFTFTDTSKAATFDVRSSLDNYASSLGSFTQNAENTGSNPTWTSASVSLTAATFQNLDTITFRIVMTNTALSTNGHVRLDNITVSGISDASTANIPEPSSYALLMGAGGLLFVASARRPRTI